MKNDLATIPQEDLPFDKMRMLDHLDQIIEKKKNLRELDS
jgi:hypothetical protein